MTWRGSPTAPQAPAQQGDLETTRLARTAPQEDTRTQLPHPWQTAGSWPNMATHNNVPTCADDLEGATACQIKNSLSRSHIQRTGRGDPPHATREKKHQSGSLRKLHCTLRESSLSHPFTSAEAVTVTSSHRGPSSSFNSLTCRSGTAVNASSRRGYRTVVTPTQNSRVAHRAVSTHRSIPSTNNCRW